MNVILPIALLLCAGQSERPSNPAFEQIKKLAGTWVSPDPEHPGEVTYKVSSGGSIVLETMSMGGHGDMVTVYQLDGDDCVLTHYCMLGNQPRMRAEKAPAPGELRFDFDGGTNLRPGDKHMHRLTLTFVDPDHLREDWVLYDGGKAVRTVTLNFVRKRE